MRKPSCRVHVPKRCPSNWRSDPRGPFREIRAFSRGPPLTLLSRGPRRIDAVIRFRLQTSAFQVVFLDFPLQSPRADSEAMGRMGPMPPRLLERPSNGFPLEILQQQPRLDERL